MKCPYCGHWMTLIGTADGSSCWMCLGRYWGDLFCCGATVAAIG